MVSGAGPASLSSTALVECVPNFSEGTRPRVMDAIQAAARSVRGAVVLDRHADPVHNRMVRTIAGSPGPVAEAAFRATACAATLIDLNEHRGVHPRIGATDVVPFVPLGATSMLVCIDLAVRVGRRIAAELDLPVYLYGEAARTAHRRGLPDLRPGELERLGPPLPPYSRTFARGDIGVARGVARGVRGASGGLPAVQAGGFRTAGPNLV